ncbi:putative S-acyltransferase [Platanthera guangdongensis]|uniref:S-acyltransferase n=1 Tax=Platanthera guangdongensis TaxID=2320717 RepID=A0ABR2MHG4_9ASPA
MRKHGWQLPYHPLQVVAIAVFLALGFAFYVFFIPFVGKKAFQNAVMAIYTPLVTCVLGLYICCAATDPGDPGVFKSKKYVNVKGHETSCNLKDSKQEGSINEAHSDLMVDAMGTSSSGRVGRAKCCMPVLLGLFHVLCSSLQQSSEQKTNEDGMFYCSLCEIEVRKYSKHCRVCDKCVDQFDHHCRWLNNCIGRKNYGRFFALMTSSLLLLILQWSIGVMVLILCFLDRKRYSLEIVSKLGSSFSFAPFTVVVASCTFLAMLATLPLAQLFFFHILLIKKGISTYDYIVAIREQEQQGLGQQSPQMSSASSLAGFSSASSFNAFQRSSWCTPPRLFIEDQFDVISQEINLSLNSDGKKMLPAEARKESTVNIKLNPWTLARLNPEQVSKAASLARIKSKILLPISKQAPHEHDADSRRYNKKRSRIPMDTPLHPSAKISATVSDIRDIRLPAYASSVLAPLQLEARRSFMPSRAAAGVHEVSPGSSAGSLDLPSFRISSSGAEDSQRRISLAHGGAEFLRSASDGYEASGGEDSDIVPSRIVHRSLNWSSVILNSDYGGE